jgi:hypothetical protein
MEKILKTFLIMLVFPFKTCMLDIPYSFDIYAQSHTIASRGSRLGMRATVLNSAAFALAKFTS